MVTRPLIAPGEDTIAPWAFGRVDPGAPVLVAVESLETGLRLETLLSITVVMTMGSVLVTGWLATVGYRAYRRRGTRLLKYATTGLALIALSRVFWFLTGYSYVVENYLTVRMILSIQILRSTTLFVGFVLVIYAIYTHD